MRDVKVVISGICSAAAVAGIVGTAVSAVAATPKAMDILKKAEQEKGEKLSKAEIVENTWKVYIPTAAIALSAIVCVVSASILDKKARVSAASAYAALSQAYEQYKLKNIQMNGKEAHQKILDSIAAEKSNGNVITAHTFCGGSSLDFGGDEEEKLFYDTFSERYFTSTISKVLQAEYHFNRNYVLRGSASMNELYDFLGISGVANGDRIGFDIEDEIYFIDFDHHKTTLSDGLEANVIDIMWEPRPIEAYG